MKTHLIIGPKIVIDLDQLQSIYQKNGNSLVVYGDAKNLIDCDAIKLPNNAHVIVNAHGLDEESGHILNLCANYRDTNIFLQKIAAKKIINFELISCHGGAAIGAIKNLAIGSTLMTFVDNKYSLYSSLQEEISFKLANLENLDNPFMRFAYHLLLNPDDNKFAIRAEVGSKIFTSSMQNLEDYSIVGVREWQKKQLLAFAKFCHGIRDHITKLNKSQIEEALDFLKTYSQLIEIADVTRYKELLLINMVRNNNLQAVEALLESGINIEFSLIDGSTPLFMAAQDGHLDIVEFLWSKGAKLDIANNKGVTPLLMAAQNGHLDIVEFLWSKGAKLDIVDNEGVTPLLMAAQNGHLDIVEFLWSKGAELDIVDNKGVTPLWMAAQNGHLDIVKFLSSKGAEVDCLGAGVTPLLIAAQKGKTMVVEVLIKANASVDIKYKDMTALLVASYRRHTDIVKLLLAAGANPNEEYQDKKILDWSNSQEIINEITAFDKSPIKYILKGNNDTDQALVALQRIEKFSAITPSLLDEIHKTEECLEAQNKHVTLNLNALCGEDGTWYHSEF